MPQAANFLGQPESSIDLWLGWQEAGILGLNWVNKQRRIRVKNLSMVTKARLTLKL